MIFSLREPLKGSCSDKKKISPFSSISMEVTTQKNNVDQIDFFMQESKTTMNSVQRFVPEKPNSAKSSTNSKEMDLSLKLSLDGSYGQNVEEMPLTRSSSIAGEITLGTGANGAQGGSSVPSLDRSCSLPVEAEKALVRFGDLQTMRRVETGKRLLQEKLRAAAERKKSLQFSSALKGPATSPAIDKPKTLANPSGNSKHEDKLASDSYNMPYKGPRGLAEVGASSHFLASAKQDNDLMVSPITKFKEMPPRPADTKVENPSKKVRRGNPCSLKGDDMDILRQMPSVATTGDGPGGRRIEGFLYKYRSGQICIVCVCHGSFLSPAEFVMHAGGNKDVANPMRHITVCANSF